MIIPESLSLEIKKKFWFICFCVQNFNSIMKIIFTFWECWKMLTHFSVNGFRNICHIKLKQVIFCGSLQCWSNQSRRSFRYVSRCFSYTYPKDLGCRFSFVWLHVTCMVILVLTTEIPSLSVVIDFLQDLDLLHRYTTSPLFKTFILR